MRVQNWLGFVPKRDPTISRTALAAGLVTKPGASAQRLMVLGQSLVVEAAGQDADFGFGGEGRRKSRVQG
jgi:hypothetical protein